METSTLRTPNKGRSRFSKALPAPPPSFDSLNMNTMVLPKRKESLGLPAIPPKEITTMSAKPLDSPLPPVPLKTSAPPTAMSIPRRSVASPPVVSPPPPAEPSPVGSISSLLSAYSRGSSDSILRSSDGTASTKDSYLEISPKKEDSINNGLKKIDFLPPLSFSFSDHEVQEKRPEKPQDGPKKAVEKLETLMADLDLPPPPPLKDPQVPRTPTSAPQSPFSATPSSAAPLSATSQSPPRSQLLRRRSLKKDKPLPLTELKLASSHGSTADSPSQVQKVQQQLSATPETLPSLAPPQPSLVSNTAVSPLSRGYTAFPGRNIKPQTSKEPSTQPPNMGEAVSKIEGKLDETFKRRQSNEKVIEGGIDVEGNIVKQVESGKEPTFRRLPTPEYQKSDVKTPITETIVSPVSPVSLTGSPEGFKAPASTTGSAPANYGGSDVASVRSDATLRPPRGPLPTIPGSPRESGASQGAQTPSTEKLSFPLRSASKQPVGAAKGLPRTPAPLNRQRAPTPSSRPGSSSSDAATGVVPKPGETAREGPPVKLTLDTKSATVSSFDNAVQAAGESIGEPLTPSHPAYFPKTLLSTSKEVAFRPAVKESHLRCFTSHATLVSDPNRLGMGKCQVCSKDDNSPRKSCGHCFLHLCEPCSQVLTDMKGNLKQLMEVVKNQGIKGKAVAAPESTTGSATSDSTIRPTRA